MKMGTVTSTVPLGGSRDDPALELVTAASFRI